MRNRGFTLIELIVTITIIGIVSLIATVSVNQFIKKSTDTAYKTIEETMKTAAEDYLLKGNDIGKISVKKLVDEKFMPTPVDPKTKKNCDSQNSYVEIKKEKVDGTINENYTYKVCLICDNYKSKSCK